ncbi:hypothetical protein EDD15DRAFT_2201843 [Pisolithus albus]|nr:hypothetical protein EDD15DRAFT_2201843 [Pisolithus albus]
MANAEVILVMDYGLQGATTPRAPLVILRAAQKRLVEEFPWLVAPDCYAHQVNLVVGDYFKVSEVQTFLTTTKKATSRKVLGVIRAVITHWTAHYLAYHQLLDLLFALQILTRHERERKTGGSEQHIIVGDAVSCRKAEEMLAVIEDSLFWHTLEKVPWVFVTSYHSCDIL